MCYQLYLEKDPIYIVILFLNLRKIIVVIVVLINPATRNEASSPLRPYNEIINGNKKITKNAYVNEDGTNSSLRKDLRYTA